MTGKPHIGATIPTWDTYKNYTKAHIAELCQAHWQDDDFWTQLGGPRQCLKCPIWQKRHKDMPSNIRGEIKVVLGDLQPDPHKRFWGEKQ